MRYPLSLLLLSLPLLSGLLACKVTVEDDDDDDSAAATTFGCGDLTCSTEDEYCYWVSGGAEPSMSYECAALPEACQEDPTCACMEAEGIVTAGYECEELPGGGLSVGMNAP